MLARDGAAPQTVVARVSEATTAGIGATLLEFTTNTADLRVPMPEVRRDAFVEVSLTTTSAAGGNGFARKPFFRWRTLLRPDGSPELDYAGRKGFEAPPDFDDYWQRAKDELAAVPLRPDNHAFGGPRKFHWHHLPRGTARRGGDDGGGVVLRAARRV